jgi:hypothetical protein
MNRGGSCVASRAGAIGTGREAESVPPLATGGFRSSAGGLEALGRFCW